MQLRGHTSLRIKQFERRHENRSNTAATSIANMNTLLKWGLNRLESVQIANVKLTYVIFTYLWGVW